MKVYAIQTNVRGNRHDTLIFYIKVDNKKSGQGVTPAHISSDVLPEWIYATRAYPLAVPTVRSRHRAW